jgi:hypothetical protein
LLPETELSVTWPAAPRDSWIPFCAVTSVAPAPMTTAWLIAAVEPGPSAVTPFFWFRYVGLLNIV